MTKKINKDQHYYKGLDENCCGCNDFQYEIGKVFTAETTDSWHLLHFAEKVSTAIKFGTRIVEVEPITPINRFEPFDDMNAKSIRILRELPKEEIAEKLFEEKCPVYKMVGIKPPYEVLLCHKDSIKRCDHRFICNSFDWLTEEQKQTLLPKSWKRSIHVHELSKKDRRV